jgi:hypothetical protein
MILGNSVVNPNNLEDMVRVIRLTVLDNTYVKLVNDIGIEMDKNFDLLINACSDSFNNL